MTYPKRVLIAVETGCSWTTSTQNAKEYRNG